MEKTYSLQGLDCAHCAGKIEAAIKALDGVSSASVNFMTATLKLHISDTYAEGITAAVETTVRQYEPEVVVADQSGPAAKAALHSHAQPSNGLPALIAGAAVFAAGMLLGRLYVLDFYAKLGIFLIAYLILGGKVVLKAAKNIAAGQWFDENFLMGIATIGAFAIGDFHEAVAVMLFYQVGEYFQNAAVRTSRKSIAELMDIRPDYANIRKDSAILRVAPDTVNIGDVIMVKPGEKIPLDGMILAGESTLDTRALTGESVPRTVRAGDTALSGCINQSGVLSIEVTKTFGESTAAKIIDLVENAAAQKSPTEHFITTFSRYYTPAVVALAALLAAIPPLFFGGAWMEWINRGLIFLVISCPCALVISIPLGFFGGIGGASKHGVLVKGGNYLEALYHLDIVVFDKTGTLTKGIFEVTALYPANGYSPQALLEYTARAEAFSNHPIARSIQKAYGKPIEKGEDYSELSGHGIRAVVGGKTVLAGSRRLLEENHIACIEAPDAGTKVYVAVEGQFAGCIVISDTIRQDSERAISGLKARGVRKTVMLTGDNGQIGETVAKTLGLDEVYAQLLPAQKVEKVAQLEGQRRHRGKIAFVGDGINDAPVLARADVGIAMGALGSDAAIEAADVVLMTDEPSKLLDAIDIARFTKRIVWQNICFALGVKGCFLLLAAFGITSMWEAVFADVGVAVIAILNAMRVLKYKGDVE